MSIEVIERDGVRYAQIIRGSTPVQGTQFISSPEDAFQLGVIDRPAGHEERAHFHAGRTRQISVTPELILMQRGTICLSFYDSNDRVFDRVELNAGDAALLHAGAHSYRV